MADNETIEDDRQSDAESIYEDAQEHADDASPAEAKSNLVGPRLGRKARDGLRKTFAATNEGLKKVRIGSGSLGLEEVSENDVHNVQKQFGGALTKETINDVETGAQVKEYRALGGMAKYTQFKEEDADGNLKLTRKDEKLVLHKAVEYGDDKKVISRGTRNGTASVSYTKSGDKRWLKGFKLGPFSVSYQKGDDGSHSRTISFGKLSYEKSTDAFLNRSVSVKIGKQFARKVTRDIDGEMVASYLKATRNFMSDWKRDEYGATETERRFTKSYSSKVQRDAGGNELYVSKIRFGKSTESRYNPDGSSIKLTGRGTRLTDLERMTPEDRTAALNNDIKSGKVRKYEVTNAAGDVEANYKESRLGLVKEQFTKGTGGGYDEQTRHVKGLKSSRSISASQSQTEHAQTSSLQSKINEIASADGSPATRAVSSTNAETAKKHGMPTKLADRLDDRRSRAASISI